MSLRAIKKRETKPYRKQATQSKAKKFLQPQIETKHRSRSLPDLCLNRNTTKDLNPPWRSESDVSKLYEKFEENANLISAKSEVCLKTISVHQTVHANMSRRGPAVQDITTGYRGDTLNNNSSTRRMSDHSVSVYSHNSNLTSPSDDDMRGFADTSCVRIPIIGYEVMEERARFTVYKLRVENPFSNDCWLVLRRYTDFVRLNNKLKQAFPLINLQLPRKKLFGDNFNSVFLDNRVQGLQRFVNSIMANNELRTSNIVREFFCLDEPPTYSESMEECRAIFEAQEETIAHLKLQLKRKDEQILSLQHKLRNETLSKESQFKHITANCRNCASKLPTHESDNKEV